MKLWGDTVDEERLYVEKKLIFDATELVAEAMAERGWTKKRLADALKVRASEITQRLRGRRNLTLRSLADMLHAMGYEARISKVKIEDTTQAIAPTMTWGPTVQLIQPLTTPRSLSYWITSGSGAGSTGAVGARTEVTAGSSLASVGRS